MGMKWSRCACSLLIIVVMLLGFTACGKKNSEKKSEPEELRFLLLGDCLDAYSEVAICETIEDYSELEKDDYVVYRYKIGGEFVYDMCCVDDTNVYDGRYEIKIELPDGSFKRVSENKVIAKYVRSKNEQIYMIKSDSMAPTISRGDVISFESVKDVSTLEIGDIITYWTIIEGERVLNTHRIAGISAVTVDTLAFTTKGDNNATADSQYVHQKDVVGKYTGVYTDEFRGQDHFGNCIPLD